MGKPVVQEFSNPTKMLSATILVTIKKIFKRGYKTHLIYRILQFKRLPMMYKSFK